jgi:hypothetical protein
MGGKSHATHLAPGGRHPTIRRLFALARVSTDTILLTNNGRFTMYKLVAIPILSNISGHPMLRKAVLEHMICIRLPPQMFHTRNHVTQNFHRTHTALSACLLSPGISTVSQSASRC